MIAETANLATAHNVVKRPLYHKMLFLGCTFAEGSGGFLVATLKRATIIKVTEVRDLFHTFGWEQTGRKRCLTNWQYGRQHWTPLSVLPAQGISE
jgi:hypothetical protein